MEKNTSKLNETAKTPAKKSKKPAKSKKPEKTVSAKIKTAHWKRALRMYLHTGIGRGRRN